MISGILSVTAIPIAVQSQEPVLTQAQQSIFNMHRLNVELTREAYGTYSGGYAGSVSAQSWTRWFAYEGFNRISEGEYFRRLGLAQQAQQAEAYRRKSTKLAWLGWGLVALGLAGSAPFIASDDATPMLVGLGVVCVGLPIGVMGSLNLRQNRFPYSAVSGLSEPYNAELRQRVLRGEVR